MLLTQKQTIALDILEDDHTTELVYGGSAGGGKSYLGVYWILKSALKYPESRWLIGRSELKSLKLTTLVSFFDVAKIQGLVNGKHYHYNQQSSVITLYNGSEIVLKDLQYQPRDPNYDSLGSLEVTGIFADEISQITQDAWKVLKSRIRYKLKEFGLKPKMLGTCNPAKNWVYHDFYKKDTEGTLEPYKRFIQALPTDNPNLTEDYLESLRTLNPNLVQRLYFGNWDYEDDPTALLEYEQILDLFNNTHVLPDKSKMAISADIATEGNDRFIVCVWCNFYLIKIKVLAKATGKDVIDTIEALSKEYNVPKSRIVFDGNGMGSMISSKDGRNGFLQGAKQFINNSRALNDENYKDLKTQCIYKFCERVAAGGYYIKDDKHKAEIIQELEQLKRYNADNDTTKLQVVGKAVIKTIIGRSPDFSDALIMREYLELKPTGFFV